MNLSYWLPFAAFAASAVLALSARARVPALFAALASGIEVLRVTGVVRVQSGSVPIGLILGAVVLVAAAIAYLRVHGKGAVSVATVATLAGLAETLRGLRTF